MQAALAIGGPRYEAGPRRLELLNYSVWQLHPTSCSCEHQHKQQQLTSHSTNIHTYLVTRRSAGSIDEGPWLVRIVSVAPPFPINPTIPDNSTPLLPPSVIHRIRPHYNPSRMMRVSRGRVQRTKEDGSEKPLNSCFHNERTVGGGSNVGTPRSQQPRLGILHREALDHRLVHIPLRRSHSLGRQ